MIIKLFDLRPVTRQSFIQRNCSTGEEMNAVELSQRAVSVAAALARRGVTRGDTVALAGEPCAAFVPTALAIMLAGAAYTPIELECGSAVLIHKFNLSKPKYVICTRLFWEANCDTLKNLDYIKTFICYDGVEGMESVEAMVSRDVDVDSFEPAAVSGDAVAAIMYSSGTTGMSKGVLLTHLSLISRLQLCSHKYPEVKIVNMYGASECFIITTTQNLVTEGSNPERATVIGVVAPGVDVKIMDVDSRVSLGPEQRGEICVRSPAMMKGYLGAPSPVDEQGFYPTGDLGYYDNHKRFYLVDRLTDMINYMGYKVSPCEVESVLLQHPAVEEAAVVGRPAELEVDQELPTAFVVLRRGTVATATELQQYVADQVPLYMQLRGGVRFLAELPRSPRRKILRQRLRELLDTNT